MASKRKFEEVAEFENGSLSNDEGCSSNDDSSGPSAKKLKESQEAVCGSERASDESLSTVTFSDTEPYGWSDWDPLEETSYSVDLSKVKVEPEEDLAAYPGLNLLPDQLPNSGASANTPRASANAQGAANPLHEVEIIGVVAANGANVGAPSAALGAPPADQEDVVDMANDAYDSDDIQIIAVQGPSWSDYDSDELPDLVNASMSSASTASIPYLYQNQLADPDVAYMYAQDLNEGYDSDLDTSIDSNPEYGRLIIDISSTDSEESDV